MCHEVCVFFPLEQQEAVLLRDDDFFVWISLEDPTAEDCGVGGVSKCYLSPWEQAIIHDPDLAETLNAKMPVLGPRAELIDYKSFNR